MAEFIAFNKKVEVNRETVMSVVNSMPEKQETRLNILKNSGIDLTEKEWFLQQDWLNAFKVIAESMGNMNLFLIGKAIIRNAIFPPINDLEQGLRLIDMAYHMNHRLNGEVMFNSATGRITEGIGHYTLTEFDAKNRKAVMVCKNPYPSEFDRGIITQILRNFKPKGTFESVLLDLSKESRVNGADSCSYIINW